jgi:hypothetical protein
MPWLYQRPGSHAPTGTPSIRGRNRDNDYKKAGP